MKTPHRLLSTFACLSLLPAGLPHLSAQQPAAAPVPPKTTPADFQAKIVKDASPLPNGGQLQMSYATVVEKILPSVVTIHSSAPIKTPEIDQIPPQLRPFFYRFFGAPRCGQKSWTADTRPSAFL